MVNLQSIVAAAAAALMFQVSYAHPGGDADQELVERAAFLQKLGPRAPNACQTKLAERGVAAKLAERRNAMIKDIRAKRGLQAHAPFLQARDLKKVLATNHHYTGSAITAESTPDVIFAGVNETVLAPETTEGPYYVSGELVRSDVTEEEPGVPLALHIQLIDINTCEPLPNIALEIWHCNATGVYGGVTAGGMGNGDAADTTLLQKKALRGIQVSDKDGVVSFESIFPGHYTGRAIHIHIMSHVDAKVNPNNTLSGGTVAHVGQLYFDQDLITQVEKVAPYSQNTARITTNENDFILAQGAGNEHDPVAEYIFVGDGVDDGIFSWLTVGIDPANEKTVNAAATCTETGCTSRSGGGFGLLGGLAGLFGGFGGRGN
ncbi:aromatic compound dioxygenase [Eremomyces bilateralis CBS 781.70]|uniref:Aromatic compound dioxygenase n=1 Tax=Eremomyces bilateralis CBS 781.70 TaxID=1392243 RepID=A0A6G1G1P8_9PEZI|nr:aromatic compound dioxygenase [Eremomyces bilateralis CBS 781.70]KAF1811851.1 aromatic compound dioxygenase [Eremomyces bilateralis CBS 781.70]